MDSPLDPCRPTESRTRKLRREKFDVFQDKLEITVKIRGKCVHVTSNFCPSPPPRKKKGSIIKAFSKAARMRVLRFSATVDWSRGIGGRFITLTYPDERVRHDKGDRKKHLYIFCRSMERHMGTKIPLVWRVEWKERESGIFQGKAAPHVHMLVFTSLFIPYWLVNEWWKQAIGWDAYVRTECRAVSNERMAGAYVSKYVAKVDENYSLVNVLKGNSTGRHYGYKRPAQIPRCSGVTILGGTANFFSRLRDIAFRELPNDFRDGDASYTLLGEKAERWKEIIVENALAEGLIVEYDH